jgi:hypothetical protein
MYMFDLLPERSERQICNNKVGVFLFMQMKYFLHNIVFMPVQTMRVGGGGN